MRYRNYCVICLRILYCVVANEGRYPILESVLTRLSREHRIQACGMTTMALIMA